MNDSDSNPPAPAHPLAKPEKFARIRERIWGGVAGSEDGQFIFSEQTSSLSEQEFTNAESLLYKVAEVIHIRDDIQRTNDGLANIYVPDGAWHPGYKNSIEHDNSIKNGQTSYALLALKDPDIVRKMRLYCQAFTGYQLATLETAVLRPWLAEKLPDDWDRTLTFFAGPPRTDIYQCLAIAGALPELLRVAPPWKFGEIGWAFEGTLINDDTYGYQQILCLMYENGIFDLLSDRLAKNGMLRIVEIGGGYGALAHHLTNIFESKVQYSIIDIPESLAFSGVYCGTVNDGVEINMVSADEVFELREEPGFAFIPNNFIPRLDQKNEPVDLCINTLSLAEMSPDQVELYCSLISRFIGTTGLFFEQNRQTNELGLAYTFPKYFKNLRQCQTNLLNNYPEKRGEANIWVNAGWSVA